MKLCQRRNPRKSRVNDRIQLAQAERFCAVVKLPAHEGWRDSNGTDSIIIDSDVTIGRDTVLMPFTLIQGKTVVGEGCEIGPWTNINGISARESSNISSRVKEAEIGDDCIIGPYAYLRLGPFCIIKLK